MASASILLNYFKKSAPLKYQGLAACNSIYSFFQLVPSPSWQLGRVGRCLRIWWFFSPGRCFHQTRDALHRPSFWSDWIHWHRLFQDGIYARINRRSWRSSAGGERSQQPSYTTTMDIDDGWNIIVSYEASGNVEATLKKCTMKELTIAGAILHHHAKASKTCCESKRLTASFWFSSTLILPTMSQIMPTSTMLHKLSIEIYIWLPFPKSYGMSQL